MNSKTRYEEGGRGDFTGRERKINKELDFFKIMIMIIRAFSDPIFLYLVVEKV